MSHTIAQPVHSRMSLLCLATAALLSSLGVSSANVALPTIAAAFGTGVQATQWVVIAYLLSSTAVIVLAGHLGDSYGRKRVLLSGMWLYAFASLLCGLSGTLGLLTAARAIQGLGGAFLMALSMALVRDTWASKRISIGLFLSNLRWTASCHWVIGFGIQKAFKQNWMAQQQNLTRQAFT